MEPFIIFQSAILVNYLLRVAVLPFSNVNSYRFKSTSLRKVHEYI